MDRAKFFASVRARASGIFGTSLSAAQVKGTEALLDEAQKRGVKTQELAYILGGVYHETGGKMVPVREGFASTDAGARAAVAKLYAKGRIKRNYALPVNGVSYYGRGRIQNTHLENYQKLQDRTGHPFVRNPDLLLDDKIDAEVTIIGHLEGIWTGKKLSDYIANGKADYYGARRIVNGTDKAAQIAVYAKAFEKALRESAYIGQAPQPKPTIPFHPFEPDKSKPIAKTAPAKSGLAAFISAILGIFKRK